MRIHDDILCATFFKHSLFTAQAATIVTIKEIVCASCDLVHLKQTSIG